MKIFLLFLLTVTAVTAAPHVPSTSSECKLRRLILAEIIEHINAVKENGVKESSQVLVENVITPKHCTHWNFCKAATVLSAFEADKLGLNERDWLLPRQLVAYSRNTQCSVESPQDQVEFLQLLENIKLCAQKEYKKNCD